MNASSRWADVVRTLRWVGYGLLGIYAVTVLAAALPIRITDPAWIERVAGSLRGGVSFPLIALALLYLGAYLAKPKRYGSALPLISPLAFLAALGFFLLIPLQTWAAVQLLNRVAAQERDQLRIFTRGLDRIRLSLTQEQLSDAIASIPGAPRFTPGTLNVPLPQARQSLINQIEPQLRLRANQLEQANSRRWQESLLRLVKDAFVSLFAALSFAAAGRLQPNRPTLLQSIQPGERHGKIDPDVLFLTEQAELESEYLAHEAEGEEGDSQPF
ncbi:MAG: hypothetical protein ACKO25_09115 [Cyanobium sp.]